MAAAPWYLVIGPTRARVLRGLPGPGALPELALRAPARRLCARLGGPVAGTGPRAAAQDLAEDEKEFLGQVVALLDAHRRAGECRALVLVGAPRLLARLRAEMPARLRALVAAEISGNLASLPAEELALRLRRPRFGRGP